LHKWRKRVKDLWYEMRLLGPLCGPVIGGAAEEADQLSDLLGDEHDLGVLRQILVELAPELPADVESLVELVDLRREQLQTRALLIGRRTYAEKPRAFARRIRRSWRTGRAEWRSQHGNSPVSSG
jgi:CHAD domain-containing protein